MKKLVLTIAIGENYQKIAQLTHSSIKKYAKKIGADFKCIDKQEISQTTPHWEKFQIFHLLNTYDRILYVDTDIIIRDDCPNLFELVPENKLGAFNEAPFIDRSKELLIDICRQYNVKLPGWNGHYFNTGVLVISKQHKYLFKKPEKEIFSFYEQSYLNMIIAKERPLMYELDYKFNRMTCMDRFTGEDRHASYIIHYAGYPSLEFITNLIPQDLEKWKNPESYKSKRHIYISVNGGLGDQVCAEPVIRFMREKLYPDDEFIVATHYPRLFKHLKKEGVMVYKHGEANLNNDTPYFIKNTLPGPETLQWSIVSHLLCHSTDYISIALMKRTLPIKDKQIKLEINLKDLSNIIDILGFQKLDDLYLVHPGKHWQSKTFPVEYWQEIINGLVKAGKKVALIGKEEAGDPPDYKPGARGTIDVECPKGAYDLRDRLDLSSLLILLASAKVLVSNDSAPIHLAGAFDNWIVLLPSCKHPDHILPFRKGSQYYKAMALYKKLALDDIESRPTQVSQTSAEFNVKDWSEYLLSAKEVINKILKI
ncbi:MAG: glycosyltransferase family 9 protein, partial [Candidatus Helarchaeota archaeon]